MVVAQVQAAEADLQEAQRQAAEAAALVATQQQLILEQHGKMQEQEQVRPLLGGGRGKKGS